MAIRRGVSVISAIRYWIYDWRAKSNRRFKRRSLLVNRRNSLSVREPRRWWRKTADQKECYIYTKLPPEIREMIFDLVMTETGILHIGVEWDAQCTLLRLECNPCFRTESVLPDHYPCKSGRRNPTDMSISRAPDVIPLLTTCRFM